MIVSVAASRSFSLAYKVVGVAYQSLSGCIFVVRFTVSRLVNKFILKK